MGTRLQAVLHAGEAGLGAWDAAPTGQPPRAAGPRSLVRQNTIGGITVADGQIEDTEWIKLKTRIQKIHQMRLADVEKKKETAKNSAVACIQELLDELAIVHKQTDVDHDAMIAKMDKLVNQKDQLLENCEDQRKSCAELFKKCQEQQKLLENDKDDEKLLANTITDLQKQLADKDLEKKRLEDEKTALAEKKKTHCAEMVKMKDEIHNNMNALESSQRLLIDGLHNDFNEKMEALEKSQNLLIDQVNEDCGYNSEDGRGITSQNLGAVARAKNANGAKTDQARVAEQQRQTGLRKKAAM